MIARYHVRWIVFDRREVPLSPEEERRLLALGCAVVERGSLVLLDLAAVCAARRLEGPGARASPALRVVAAAGPRRSGLRAGPVAEATRYAADRVPEAVPQRRAGP